MGTDKVVIVVKDGMVQEVFGSCPYKFDVEVLDMDFNGADPDAENAAQDRLQTVRQYLSKSINGKEKHYARKETTQIWSGCAN